MERYEKIFDDATEASIDDDSGPNGIVLPGAPQPTDTHRKVVDLLDSILTLGAGAAEGEQGHPMLRASLRTIRKLRPVALEELARVPEDEVRAFLEQLRSQIAEAIGPSTPGDQLDAASAGPRSSESAPT